MFVHWGLGSKQIQLSDLEQYCLPSKSLQLDENIKRKKKKAEEGWTP